jgi:hypothetical protein
LPNCTLQFDRVMWTHRAVAEDGSNVDFVCAYIIDIDQRNKRGISGGGGHSSSSSSASSASLAD